MTAVSSEVSTPLAASEVHESGPRVSRRLTVAAIGTVVAIGVVMRFASTSHLWLDEALTVNIARLSLQKIPAALRHDGSPPLYYAMLHVWMRVFGTGDSAVRALPGLLGVFTIPVAYFCGGGLRSGGRQFDRRAAVTTMLLVATSPWAIRYSTENRMYSLAILLVLLGILAVSNAMRSPAPWSLAAVALVTAALLYTTYWAFFLLAVVGVVLLARCVRAQPAERGAAIRLIGAVVAGCGLFVPWLPILVTQLRHTGTPWSRGPKPIAFVTTITQFGGANFWAGRVLTVLLIAAALVALSGLAVPRLSRKGDRNGTRRVRLAFAIGAATLILGVGEAMLSNTAYQVRYAAVVFPFAALVAGSVLLERRVRVVVVSAMVVFGLVAAQHWITLERTASAYVASVINEKARAGDVVVFCPDQVGPSTTRLIRASIGLRQVTFPTGDSPRFVNWTDYAKRNEAADPARFARTIDTQASTSTIWYVLSPGYLTYGLKCEALATDLGRGRPPGRTVVPIRGTVEHLVLIEYDPHAKRSS
jgi:mannosyltransferase